MSKYIMAPDYVLEAYKQPRAYERSMAVERACGETEPSRTGTQPKQPPSPPSESPGRTTVSGACVYYMDPSRIDEILRARPGVCSRYGPDQIICQADTSPSIGGGSVPQTETYEAKLKRDIESAVEQQATGPRFDHTRTEILINNYEKPPNWHAGLEVTRRPFSRDYWQLAQQVVKQFSDQGRFVPPDRRSHKIRVVLGREQPASSPAGGSQSGGTPCPYVPGQLLQGHAEQTGTSENRPPLQGGTGTTGYPYPPPQTVPPPLEPPQPVQEYVHGLVWRWIQTDGQKTIFPIRIQVPTNMPLNEYQEGPLSLGPEGQYYNKFGGRLLKQWSPPQLGRGEVPGLFQITRLYTVNGTMETVNMRIPLYSQPPR